MTENARRSVVTVLPVPDGTIGDNDRMQAAQLYSGIDPSKLYRLSVTSVLGLTGALSSRNPNWLRIAPSQSWQGVWSIHTIYDVGDVVLYTSENVPHAFVSKLGHNVGNVPTASHLYWTRLTQERWRE